MLLTIYSTINSFMYNAFYYIIDKFLDLKVYITDIYKRKRNTNTHKYHIAECVYYVNKTTLDNEILFIHNGTDIEYSNNAEYYKFIVNPSMKLNNMSQQDYMMNIYDTINEDDIINKFKLCKIKNNNDYEYIINYIHNVLHHNNTDNDTDNYTDNDIICKNELLSNIENRYMCFTITITIDKYKNSIDITKLMNMFYNSKPTIGIVLLCCCILDNKFKTIYNIYVKNNTEYNNIYMDYEYMTNDFNIKSSSTILDTYDIQNIFGIDLK